MLPILRVRVVYGVEQNVSPIGRASPLLVFGFRTPDRNENRVSMLWRKTTQAEIVFAALRTRFESAARS